MNITFMIGNGFDVGLGLPSKFKDFFPTYVEDSKNKPPEIKQLSERIHANYKTWADFETRMGQYTNEFGASNKHQYSLQFRDFETAFVQHLKHEERNLSFDDADGIRKMMIAALTSFYSLDNLRYGSNNVIANVFQNRKSEEHRYNFISFNYTNLLEKCLSTLPKGVVKARTTTTNDKVGSIVHVHGTSDDAPIMGVNDVSQIANKELAKDERFIRYIVKPMLNSVHRTDHDARATNLISSSQIICIYGMALGATDKLWWGRVLTWLNGASDRQLVIFDYDPDFVTASQFDWIDKEDAIIDRLAPYVSDSKIDVEKLRPRIHIAVHKNIFEMNLRKVDPASPVTEATKAATVAVEYLSENKKSLAQLV